MKRTVTAFLIILLCIIVGKAGGTELEISPRPKASRVVPGEIIIELKRGTGIKSESINALNKKYGLVSIEKLFSGTRKDEPSDLYVFRFPKDTNVDELISVYKKDKDVLYAEANYTVHSGPSF